MGEEEAMDLGYAGLLTDEKEWLRFKKKLDYAELEKEIKVQILFIHYFPPLFVTNK